MPMPTGIGHSERPRPGARREEAAPTPSQRAAQLMSEKAVSSGKVSAADLAQFVFDAMESGRFYIFSHPTERALGPVGVRGDDIVKMRNPTDPFAHRPDLAARLREALEG